MAECAPQRSTLPFYLTRCRHFIHRVHQGSSQRHRVCDDGTAPSKPTCAVAACTARMCRTSYHLKHLSSGQCHNSMAHTVLISSKAINWYTPYAVGMSECGGMLRGDLLEYKPELSLVEKGVGFGDAVMGR